jgi:hypothetical protein
VHCVLRALARESLAFGGRRPSEDGGGMRARGGLEARQRNWGSAGANAKEAEGGPDSGPPETLSSDLALSIGTRVRSLEIQPSSVGP